MATRHHKMATRPRRDSTSSLAAAMQNKANKDTIGDDTRRAVVRMDRDNETESEVSYGQLAAILDAGMVEAGIENQYKAWFHYKLARPLSVFLMVLIAMPMALQISRRGSILSVGFGIVLAGFAYFILESLFLSLAETGTLPAMLAVWSPPALTLLVSSWLILLLEG